MSVQPIDPASGQPLAFYEETPPEEVDEVLGRTYDAAAAWRLTSPIDRVRGARRLAGSLRRRREELALMATREMGKPLVDSRSEVAKCASACEWFADHGPAMLEPEPVQTGAIRTQVVYVPVGVLFAVMPWNFPYWQVVRALAPALAAGNVVVLKHAPSTTNPDFVAYAESFGARGYRIESAAELLPTLRDALADDTVSVIACPVDYSANLQLTDALGELDESLS